MFKTTKRIPITEIIKRRSKNNFNLKSPLVQALGHLQILFSLIEIKQRLIESNWRLERYLNLRLNDNVAKSCEQKSSIKAAVRINKLEGML